MKKKVSDSSLPTTERLILAAQEVLDDEKKLCKGRMNVKQIAQLMAMIPKRKQYKGMY